ncbi:MAG: SIS domain-containing protein [Bacteroidota bacterium]|nr:SIS domain-containing protein [Bacteroidota bacterium]MDP4234669.1 SIS domain-containing protein [Bacteroidota bacterium]MDP4243834.1 SIS domain-containing protein [Bacteroidota bacterium]MDP4288575.1 SIS domain-containing protein [Bacteroidota bacterium]
MADSHILASFQEAQTALADFLADAKQLSHVEAFVDLLVETFQAGGKVYSAGNGGSHCDAMHFAEEWTGRYRKDRKPMPALAFSDPSHITCTSNDYGFEHIFERMVDAFGAAGDVFVAITTSGNSQNLILAAEAAKRKGMKIVGLLGKGGGAISALCDIPIVVPGHTSDRIQELHIKIIHITIECAERRLFPELY